MPYNPSVPKMGNSGSMDYIPIQENFAQLQTSFSINHEPLGTSGAVEGYHTQIQLAVDLPADPNKAAPISSVYTKGTPPQLFFQNGNMAANVVQLTGNAVLSGTEYTVVTSWGLVLKFGQGSSSPGGTLNTFTVPFPVAVQGVLITVQNAGNQGNAVVLAGVNSYTAYCQSGVTQATFFIAWGT